jgi:plasmid stability protein
VAALLIRDLPKELHRKLKARAAANGRSLSSEAIFILETVLQRRSGPLPLAEIDRLRTHGVAPLRQSVIDRARRRDR